MNGFATNELRQRLAEAERKAADTPEALRAALALAEASDREAREESNRRVVERNAKVGATVDCAAEWIAKLEPTAFALVEAMTEAEAALGALSVHTEQKVLIGDIQRLLVTRVQTILGNRFGAPPLQGPGNRSLHDTVPPSWLRRLVGLADEAA